MSTPRIHPAVFPAGELIVCPTCHESIPTRGIPVALNKTAAGELVWTHRYEPRYPCKCRRQPNS